MSFDTSKLEQAAIGTTTNAQVFAIFSIAISLKRIADAMDERNEYGEGPAAAIGAGIARSLKQNL